ncbi:MAG: Hsp20/alpha crystallin family protein [Bacteroidales bacterium]
MIPMIKSTSNYLPSMWDQFMKDFENMEERTFQPAINVKETGKDYQVEVSAPGFEKKDFDIDVDNHRLIISYEHKDEKEEKSDDEKYYRREFGMSSFTRTFELPEDAKEDDIQAKYDKGILLIVIPKTSPREDVKKKISIK